MYSYSKNSHYTDSAKVDEVNSSNMNTNLETVQLTETEKEYHLELEISGYIKDDFNFFITVDNELVLTTARSNETSLTENKSNNVIKHSYCYPSAFLRKTFRLPKNIVKNEIFVDYKNHILSIDLLKLNPSL